MKKLTNGTPLNKATLKELERIAMRASYNLEKRGGIDGRMNDAEDFPEISIYSIATMLANAYRFGYDEGRKTGHKDCWKESEKEA